ncbi:UDP-N-acetylmuramoyl-L-alanyl-D-glutamate--2,6-diaminopimelate ligase [Peribacillus cavernae]|uniref:UDP-N-acetylmuramoyl-L-alanyl-D-glutamate--2, 6-diaminopimelate ligase n=1 Tax=Peribacillus cavernae TaxID=1674310 RepID=A0A3S0W4B7_9BACI|nr:UDP-N-acetylmuramoyl-L-alanyl-D-glutamate--2,6-diaminopimelate ligase [Peribacillus cavernae]MDQ0221004.1 UDP-N-acetylmuramoyl-L-alanyl-D-glutamate--2,6-diaminopimelate ligase [Peribacillus cavernae]RUQ27454.1 UDP-N-acetylmuramoyl-L-alanyl-D-glutamate--2,6-diaminopimelate ligase [Peribacillus cavernae]
MKIHFEQHEQLGIKGLWGQQQNTISAVLYDSRKAIQNSAFVCISGENHDGHSFLEDAIKKGATVLAGENKAILKPLSTKYPDRTFLLIEDARVFLAHLSILFYTNVHRKLLTVGITGTNGKTTVAAYVTSLLNLLGSPAGLIGTTGIWSSKGNIDFEKTTPTTPEAPELHEIFNNFHQCGDKVAAMEVSSIAIEQKRVEGIDFDIAIHTNLSPEHLEFHHTFENYKKAKLKLFDQAKKAVVNYDDQGMATEIIESFQGPLLTYSLDKDSSADVIGTNIKVSNDGTSFELRVKGELFIVHTPVFGNYNVANLLASICTGLHLGFSIQNILLVLPQIEGPEGRFEILKDYGNRKIILDYAHTPVALKSLVTEAKKLTYNRLIVLITGIGIRDKEKMPKMAETVEGEVDEIIVAVDHPGFHDPKEIIGHVLDGFSNRYASNIHTGQTRHEGVLTALSLSEENDLILLTSGCINGAQLVKGEKIPHSDKDIIKSYFETDHSVYDWNYAEA